MCIPRNYADFFLKRDFIYLSIIVLSGENTMVKVDDNAENMEI